MALLHHRPPKKPRRIHLGLKEDPLSLGKELYSISPKNFGNLGKAKNLYAIYAYIFKSNKQ